MEPIQAVYASAINPITNIPLLVCSPNGQTFVNRAKYAQKVYHMAAEDYPLTLSSGARGRTYLLAPADQGGEGDVELYYLMASASNGSFSVSLNLTTLNRRLMNGPVEGTLVFGNGVLPARLITPLFIPATTTLEAELVDLSEGSNAIRIAGIGHQIVDPMANLSGLSSIDRRHALLDPNKHIYWLTTDDGAEQSLASGTTKTMTFTVPSIADFNCWGILHRTTADFTIQIYEGNRRRLMNKEINVSQIAGQTLSVTGFPGNQIPAAGMPMYWPFTHVFQRGTVIKAECLQSSGSVTASIAFVGELVYHQPSPPGLALPRPTGRFAR